MNQPNLKTYELLSFGTNAKLNKGDTRDLLAGLSLAPADTVAGLNVCPSAKAAECLAPCLFTAGRGRFANVEAARVRRSTFLRDDRAGFMAALDADIKHFTRDCLRWARSPVVRLNLFSDLNFNDIIRNNPAVQFHDYTKRPAAFRDKPDNLHLTLSFSDAPKYRRAITPIIVNNPGINVAVVFSGKVLPSHFMGRPVIDGDEHDRRYEDPAGVVVGLRAKGKAIRQPTALVIPIKEIKP